MASTGPTAVVLSPLHVSCFVTAANRATPVFDVQSDRPCVRVVTKSVRTEGGSATTTIAPTPVSPSAANGESPTVEWEFDSVFASATLANAFFRDVTQPAAESVVVDGINANILALGVHPTQKFRFLFGKATTSTPTSLKPDMSDTLEQYGQVGGLLYDFFEREAVSDWSVGLSSWILVNNEAVDLLQLGDATSSPLSFVSIEATSFASALETLQTAKTHRIVRKHTAEHVHFFVRLAFFHRPTGQLSTLHVVDLNDLKDFGDDRVATQEKLELYGILHGIRQQTQRASPKRKPSLVQKTMLLSNFVQPLLTQNARTFLYANVIDSRASLRESVALLNAVANVKGFACVCKRLTGVAFDQLGFQSLPVEKAENETTSLDSAAAKAMAAVAIGESLLHRLSSSGPASDVVAAASPVVTSDAMSWLEAFKQRKKDILTTVVPVAPPVTTRPAATVLEELPLGLSDAPPSAGSSSDLYARLMETIGQGPSVQSSPVATHPSVASLRMQLHRSNSMPLPIEDPVDDVDALLRPPPPLPRPQPVPPSPYDLGARSINGFGARLGPTLNNIELPTQVMTPPNVDGLDATTAARIQATDAALLRKNYDALLAVVREQQQLREAAEARAQDLVHDHEERRAQYEVHIENLKLEAVALKSKVRMLEKQSGVAQVFEQYEREVQSLQRELQQLRMQNVELELKVSGSPSSVGDGPGPGGLLTDLKKRYQALALDKLELEQQLAELRKKERQFHAQSRLIDESTRKVDRLSRELAERDGALTSTRLGKQRLSAEVAIAQQETHQLQQENERLLLEKAATTEELLAAKMYLASVESEQKKAEILDQFVRKHGDRMQRLRGNSDGNNSGSWLEPENWRRDAQARDAEEKLFQGVKRSVPQLVPLANKVLRKLEVQELSLREFAEREVDFINLLVELASDQPALALKTMIEDEMKKLSLF